MAGKTWNDKDIEYLKNNYETLTCAEIAKKIKRTTRSVQHKYGELGLEKRKAKVGEVVKGWEIVEVFSQYNGSQNVSMAKIKSTIDTQERVVRLSALSNNQIAYPDRKRPDNVERNTTHGMSKTKLYSTWAGMISRCSNKIHVAYDSYGGKGVKICDSWLDFEQFKNWALSNGYQENLTLDRIDSTGNYEPSNCKWSTKTEQSINRSITKHLMITAFGETKHIIEWLNDERCKVQNNALRYRIRAGWEPEKALTQPPERKSKQNITNWLKSNYPEIYREYNNV
jgi:hypothetical protein